MEQFAESLRTRIRNFVRIELIPAELSLESESIQRKLINLGRPKLELGSAHNSEQLRLNLTLLSTQKMLNLIIYKDVTCLARLDVT